MGSVKKPLALLPARSLKKELDYLYARRSALDQLIVCLEDYTRFKTDSTSPGSKRKMA
jgi:hypothetical protein